MILAQIQNIIEADTALSDNHCRSIGILSPFRTQSDYLRKLIGKNIELDALQKHEILVGTPYFFQGKERDVMLLSFALDDATHPSAFQYLNKADVFNVSITRARQTQHIFTSFDAKKLKQDSLLKNYLSHARQLPDEVNSKQNLPQDIFMEEVMEALHGLGLEQVYQNYHITALDVDIVVVYQGKTYCIDLVGYPGMYEGAFPLERIKMFNRMNIRVFSLPFLLWVLEREQCMKALRQFLNITILHSTKTHIKNTY